VIDVERIKAESQGKWLGIYDSLGVDVGTGKHQACPLCGGKDRFRCDNKDGMGEYICNQCGAGNGFSLIMKVFGIEFLDAVKKVSEILGVIDMDNFKPKARNDPKEALNKLWQASQPLSGSDPVSKYLHSRKLVLTPKNVRYCPNCYDTDTKKEYPAMVAMIHNKDGTPVSIHRTYLDGEKKASIESPRKIMPAVEPLQGSAIRLLTPGIMSECGTVGIAEGIETAIAAAQLFGIATWAVLSTSLMVGFDPPIILYHMGYKHIVVFGDNDVNFAGQKAAYEIANKLYLKDFIVDVYIPDMVGDWNDYLLNRERKNRG